MVGRRRTPDEMKLARGAVRLAFQLVRSGTCMCFRRSTGQQSREWSVAVTLENELWTSASSFCYTAMMGAQIKRDAWGFLLYCTVRVLIRRGTEPRDGRTLVLVRVPVRTTRARRTAPPVRVATYRYILRGYSNGTRTSTVVEDVEPLSNPGRTLVEPLSNPSYPGYCTVGEVFR